MNSPKVSFVALQPREVIMDNGFMEVVNDDDTLFLDSPLIDEPAPESS